MMGSRRFDVTEHLSEEELDRAINEAQKADEARLVRRLCFVKNLYAGDVLEEAARRVGVSQANSSRWAHAWNDTGVDGLRPSFGGGRPPKLSDKQFAEMCEILKEGQPWTKSLFCDYFSLLRLIPREITEPSIESIWTGNLRDILPRLGLLSE